MTTMFIHESQRMHLIMGAVSLWTRPPALHLCAGPQKLPPSAHQRDDELPRRRPQRVQLWGTCLCRTTGMSTILSTNCWNLSLKITGTPTTSNKSLRELPPLPLFLLPPLPSGGRGGPVPGRMLGGRDRLARMDLGAKPCDPLLHLLPPLFLLQGLFRLDGVLEEELEGGVVDGFGCRAGQQRHGQRRRRGSHVTDRDCPTPRLRLRRDTLPLPREWRLLCP